MVKHLCRQIGSPPMLYGNGVFQNVFSAITVSHLVIDVPLGKFIAQMHLGKDSLQDFNILRCM